VEYIHPSDSFMFTDLAEIDLGRFEVLMSEYYLRHDF
jgi:hypothetical protein